MAKAIRRTEAKEKGYGPDPSLDLPQGAHLRIGNTRVFPPKFHEETGDLWGAAVSLRLKVLNDFTAEGDADGEEFFDSFPLKFDEAVAEKFGIVPADDAKDKDGKKMTVDKFLKDAKKDQFTPEQQAALLDEDNWTVRDGTKLGNLQDCLYGVGWTTFDPDDLEDKEFRAKVIPRNGKRSGSYLGWESFMAMTPPEKTKKRSSKVTKAQEQVSEAKEGLTPEEEAAMNAALPSKEDAA
jgi:hypothetical protein